MNEKHKSYNITDNDETIKKKSINSNNVNKKVVDKNTKRKQKRLFQMHKRLALFNEEDLPELTSDNNTKYISNDINNFNSSKNCTQIQSKNKFPTEKKIKKKHKDSDGIEPNKEKKIIKKIKKTNQKKIITDNGQEIDSKKDKNKEEIKENIIEKSNEMNKEEKAEVINQKENIENIIEENKKEEKQEIQINEQKGEVIEDNKKEEKIEEV